jgi:hypothetical protein
MYERTALRESLLFGVGEQKPHGTEQKALNINQANLRE